MSRRPESDAIDDGGRQATHALSQARRHLLHLSLRAAPVLMTITSGPAIAKKAMTASAQCSASVSAPTRGVYECTGKTHVSWCRDAHSSTTDDGNADWNLFEKCYVSHGRKSIGHGWPQTCDPKVKHYGSNRPQVRTLSSESWSTSANHYEVMNRHCAKSGVTVDKYWDMVENPGKQTEHWRNRNQGRPSPSSSEQTLRLAAHCSAAFLNCEAGRIPGEICDADRVREIWTACKDGGTWKPQGSVCQQPWSVDDVCKWFNSMCSET